MPYNGSGVFVRLYSWVNDAAANIKIRADRMDNEMNGMATGLSTCITKDGQTTVTANLPMANYRHTGVGEAQQRNEYATFGQLQDNKAAWVVGGGTGDAITASYAVPITALVDGQLCWVRAPGPNATTTPTFSPNALTARTITYQGGAALPVGAYSTLGELILRYNLANTRWELLNPEGTAIPYTPASSSAPASLDFAEDTDNGTNKITVTVATALSSDYVFTLPSRTGTAATESGTTMDYQNNTFTNFPIGPKNLLINGQFNVNQRALTSTADDVYGLDRWYTLCDGGSVTIAQQTKQENGQPYNIRLTQPDASPKRIGLAQIVEGKNCMHLRGQPVTFSGRIRSSSSQAIRFAIVEWTGTEDAPTSDVVNNWASGTYTTGNFFISTTTTITAVGSITPSAATWTDFSLSGTLSSSFTNVTVFVWTEGTFAQNATLDIGLMQLERNSVKSDFEYRQYSAEYIMCQRYLPAFNATANDQPMAMQGMNASTTVGLVLCQLPVEPRTKATGVTASGATHFALTNNVTNLTRIASTAIGFNSTAITGGVGIVVTVASGLTAGAPTILYSANSAAQLLFTGCEL